MRRAQIVYNDRSTEWIQGPPQRRPKDAPDNPRGKSPVSPDINRDLQLPATDKLRDPGPGSLGDADAWETIDIDQNDVKEIGPNNLPENQDTTRNYQFDLGYAPAPLRGPKRTHTVFDAQQEEINYESVADNSFVDSTYPFVSAFKLSSYVQFRTRNSILNAMSQVDQSTEVQDLVTRFKQGDQEAGDELQRLYSDMVREAVQRRAVSFDKDLFSPEDVQEMAKEANLALVNALLRWDGRQKLSQMLWDAMDTAVVNVIRDVSNRGAYA